MAKMASSRRASSGRLAVRAGRPPRERVGEVDERILDAARRVFSERGLDGASIDEIAAVARAGKPTIYARFHNKEALYSAVVMRNVVSVAGAFEHHIPAGATIDERLTKLAKAFLQRALTGNTVDLMRGGISEARRFPDLATSVHRLARERGEEIVSRLLREVAQSGGLDSLPAFAPERLATTTKMFVDLVFIPMIMRALFGEKLPSLCAEIGPHVQRSVTFFLAACRHAGVD
jgi:AcrR family transcriptional regulator